MKYNFEVERERRPRKEKGKNLRIFILFMLVALITAGVIYAILPENTEQPPAGENTPQNTTENTAEKASGEAENTVPDPGNSENNTPNAENNTGTPDSGTDTAGEAAGNDTTAGKDTGNTSGTTPEKNAKFDPSQQELFRITRQFRLDLQTGDWSKSKYAIIHPVESNDSVGYLAGKYHNTRLFVQRYNAIPDVNKIRIGQKIAFIKADAWQIIISQKSGTLQINRIVDKNAVPLAVFECRISRVSRRDLVICRRQVKSTFRDDHGRVFKNGTEGNPYGEFRIVLADAKAPASPINYLSIHDTGDPKAAEASLRNGAVIMAKEDIELLYCLIPERTPVKIVE